MRTQPVTERQRLLVEHVEPRAPRSRPASRASSSASVSTRPARDGVDEVRRRPHRGELVAADDAAGRVGQHEVERHARRGRRRARPCDDQAGTGAGRALVGQVRAPGDDLHPEGSADGGHRRCRSVPRPSSPSVAPARSVPTVCCHGSPRAQAHRLLHQVPGEPEDQRPGQLGRRAEGAAGAADGDAAARRRRPGRSRRCASRWSPAAGGRAAAPAGRAVNGVRSRIATTISAPARAATTASSSARWSRTTLSSTSRQPAPVGVRHRDALVVVEHHAPHGPTDN